MSAKKKPPKKKTGRKWFDGKPEAEIITKVEEAWGWGCTDAEAAFYADISAMTLSRYQKYHPNIKLRKAALLERPLMLARKAILGAFDGHEVAVWVGRGKKRHLVKVPAAIDPDTAIKYVERKHRKEFSTRSEFTGADGAPLPVPTVHVYLPHNSRDPIPPAPAKAPPKGDKAG